MKKCKIMLFIPFLALAGAEVMVCDLATGLSEEGFEVIVVSFYNYKSSITEKLESKNIRIVYLGKKQGIDIGIFFKIFRLIRKERPCVVHTHLNIVKYVMPAAILFHIKCRIHTVHNLADKEQGKIDRKLTGFFAKYFNLKLVGISPLIQDSISKEYGIAINKIPMVFNGRNLSTFITKQDYSTDETIKILHVGRFSYQKNHEMLLAAFKDALAQNKHLRLYLIGEGELQEPMRRYAHELEVEDKVEFMGIRDDIGSIMPTMDMFVLPSRYEGMPITLIEAMACGMPIIATNVGGVPDMLNSENAILINDDRMELKNAILKLADSSNLRERLGKRAKKASAQFSYYEMTRQYAELYNY